MTGVYFFGRWMVNIVLDLIDVKIKKRQYYCRLRETKMKPRKYGNGWLAEKILSLNQDSRI